MSFKMNYFSFSLNFKFDSCYLIKFDLIINKAHILLFFSCSSKTSLSFSN